MRRTDVIVLQIAFSTCHENGWFVCLSRHRSLGKTGFEGLESWSGGRTRVKHMFHLFSWAMYVCISKRCYSYVDNLPTSWKIQWFSTSDTDGCKEFPGFVKLHIQKHIMVHLKMDKMDPPGRGDEPNLQIIQWLNCVGGGKNPSPSPLLMDRG